MKRRKAAAIGLVVLLLLAGSIVFIISYWLPKPRFYTGFGLEIPEQYSLIGIDVSRYQGKIFWEIAAQMQDQDRRLSFVFIKATDGANNTDQRFERNWEQAGKTTLTSGAYHYFHPAQSVATQAKNFLEHTALAKGNLRPVLDVEVAENVAPYALRDSICKWLTLVGNYYETAPIIYTNASFYNRYLKGFFDDYPLWIAHYKTNKPAIKTDFQLWQFSDEGQVNGIDSKVDFNIFNGDSTAFKNIKMQ